MPTERDGNGVLRLGGVDLGELAREGAVGTPAYVYDLDAMAQGARVLRGAFQGAPHLVAYAIKANSAGPVVRTLLAEGCGADVVSGAELRLAMACGVDPDAILFSGVAKTDGEIDDALGAGSRGIAALQVESLEEIPRIAARARATGRSARISLRINPAVDLRDLDTHVHVATGHDEAKFGVPRVDLPDAFELLAAFHDVVSLVGLGAHVGSQFTSTDPYLKAARVVFDVAKTVRARFVGSLRFVDAGGGFGVDYGEGCPVTPADFVRAVRQEQAAAGLADLTLVAEPGRSLVAAHGVLLARVIQTKEVRAVPAGASRPRWLMIDAGMNDLLRPALYQARHRVVPLASREGATTARYRVVGPVCESSDDFGEHLLPHPAPMAVALLDAGAYGYTMASNYNGRPLPAEVFLAGGQVQAENPRASDARWFTERASVGEPRS